MIPLYWQVPLALGLDALCGDPRWLPHPVRGVGVLAQVLENPLRRLFAPRSAGIVAVLLVVGLTTGCCLLLLSGAALLHPLLADLLSILLIYFALAMQDLRRHALAVLIPLRAGNLALARERVGWLVGRDTADLDEGEITRATVESVAENSVDGVIAPLLFALLGGAAGAWFYKAVNTLDSTFGYKNERYLEFGWASARFDDLVNFLPARLSALLVPPAALLCGLDGREAWRIFRRDRHCHPSPNGGQIEAAVAGALGVRLGGENSYFGVKSVRPFMGDARRPLRAEQVLQATRLMVTLTLLVAGLGIAGLYWLR
ncbi:adenosylcobinamide-phosphate synthase CbiB [Pelobacter seleniigenes]|uniref:adenosylcobinamide-phosphate synthase CbiB n=1 Tax=Pelobacter seleniigenes TaxID=407188 RepID=UPI000B2623D0|nr:adenosylcobinamide-phosphate synthase CbiB [Pelobacter seleniigenes]